MKRSLTPSYLFGEKFFFFYQKQHSSMPKMGKSSGPKNEYSQNFESVATYCILSPETILISILRTTVSKRVCLSKWGN